MGLDRAAYDRNKDNNPSSPEGHQFLRQVCAYRDAIGPISHALLMTPMSEIISKPAKIQDIEKQIADIISNLEALEGNPLGKRFNKTAVLNALNKARAEINKALFKAQRDDASCFDHIGSCRNYLQLASGLMKSLGG